MSDTTDTEFGGIEKDVDGDVQSRKVQTEGRLNIPDEYLSYIGVDEGEEVFVGVDGDKIIIREATIDSLGVLLMMDTIHAAVVGENGLEVMETGQDNGK